MVSYCILINRKSVVVNRNKAFKMTEQEKLKSIWDNISRENPLLAQQYLKQNASAFVQYVIAVNLEKEKFEIIAYKEWWKNGSMIKFAEKDHHKKIELRMKKNNSFEIQVSIKRADEQEQVLKHKLSDEETRLIPRELTRLMHNIKELKKSATFYNTLTTR